MAFTAIFMLLPLVVSGEAVSSASEQKCAEDYGHDSATLLQKEVGVRNVLEEGSPRKAARNVPSMSRDEILSKLAQKQGMNANKGVTKELLSRFTDLSSWFWTYSLAPSQAAAEWGQEHGKEFVPLVNLKRVLPTEYGRCSFKKGTCTVEKLVEVLEDTKKKVTTNYLMGYNEPYADHDQDSSYANKGAKGVSGEEGAEWWRMFIQPAAERTNLKLVSPTTGISSQKSDWLVKFLQACYDHKDSSPPCNVEKIQVFSVHEYKCYASFWRKYAALDPSKDVEVRLKECEAKEGRFKPKKEENFYVRLKQKMRERYGPEKADHFWDPYLDGVKLWVTETSCSGDNNWNRKADSPQTPTAEESCEGITGQSCQRQRGSIQAMLGLDNIERFSWFTLFPSPKWEHPNYKSIMAAAMINANTSEPLPPGRALLEALDPQAAQCRIQQR